MPQPWYRQVNILVENIALQIQSLTHIDGAAITDKHGRVQDLGKGGMGRGARNC